MRQGGGVEKLGTCCNQYMQTIIRLQRVNPFPDKLFQIMDPCNNFVARFLLKRWISLVLDRSDQTTFCWHYRGHDFNQISKFLKMMLQFFFSFFFIGLKVFFNLTFLYLLEINKQGLIFFVLSGHLMIRSSKSRKMILACLYRNLSFECYFHKLN